MKNCFRSGGILGAIFMTVIPELLKLLVSYMTFIPNATAQLSPIRTIVFGALIIGFLLFEPQGLVGIWRRAQDWVLLWPFRQRPLGK